LKRRTACSIRHGSKHRTIWCEALQSFGDVSNAALLFMHPETGLRAINEVEQLACFEACRHAHLERHRAASFTPPAPA
jgi:hypothetical protein